MNILAEELNSILEETVGIELLSDFGKRIYFPKGIAAQSAEAKKDAKKYNATIGMAFNDGAPIELSELKKQIPELTPAETVSYAPTPGDAELRNLWQQEICGKNPGIDITAISMPIVTSGLTHGIGQIADLFLDKGDNIVIPDMFWGNYKLIFEERRQSKIVSFPFFSDNGSFNAAGFKDTMKKSANGKKICVILNFPNNPTGYSPTKGEAEQIVSDINELAGEGYKILVITDDAYFGLFYEKDIYPESLFSPLSGLHKNVLAVKIDGATKEDFVWGFRIGFITFGSKGMQSEHYEALNKKTAGAIRCSISNSSRPAQSLLLKGMQSKSYAAEKAQYRDILSQRYKTVKEILNKRKTGSALKPLPFNSGYFMSFILEGKSAEKLRLELLHKEGIGTISIQDKYLRIAYSSIETVDLEELYEIVFAAVDRI